MSITSNFFKDPERHIEELDSSSAKVLLQQMSREIPSCLESLRNLSQTHASIHLLEKKVIELNKTKKDDDLLLAFGKWKQLTQESLLTDIFCNHHAYFEDSTLDSLGRLVDTLGSLEDLPHIKTRVATFESVKETASDIYDRLTSLYSSTHHDKKATWEKCKRVLTQHLTEGNEISKPLERSSPTTVSLDIETVSKSEQITQIINDVHEGQLARAFWPVSQGIVKLEEIEHLVDKDVYEWMQLSYYFDPHSIDLETMALSQKDGARGYGLGYKSANLTILSNHAAEISRQTQSARVAIPSFLPISDFEMQRYIFREYPEILNDWAKFIDSFSKEDRAAFTPGSLILSTDAKKVLSHIRENIADVFEKKGYDTPFLAKWLEKQNPEFVIVRSTGKEDSDTNSNAGGNASIPFVRPEPKVIAQAMSEVLTSYFGEKSILQRIAAGDSSLFDKELFLPVLIQEMVGEPVHRPAVSSEEIPRSGVIFTVSAGDSNISELSVGLGNNEGVVSSSVVTDHYLLDKEGGVVKAVRDKGMRFVAELTENGTYTCQAVENSDPLLRSAPALSLEIARDIKRMSDYFSKEVYGQEKAKPLDMEFSVMTPRGSDKPVIYLLQARPLIILKKEKEPSYIDGEALKSMSEESRFFGKTLIDGGAYVRSTSDSSMIVCDTIKEALTLFLKSPPAIQSHIKTVVIAKTAPITSHEAVTLRARGIGILVIEDKESFTKAKSLHEERKPMLVDMQRGLVIEKPSQDIIKNGYTCYPIPLEYSITPSRELVALANLWEIEPEKQKPLAKALVKHLSGLEKSVSDLIQELKGEADFEKSLSSSELQTWKNTLETIASGTPDQVKLASAHLLDRLKKLTLSKELQALPKTRLELFIVLEEVKKIIEERVLKTQDKDPLSLERLYPVRMLEACLFQTGDVLGGFSALRCLKAIRDQKEIVSATGTSLKDTLSAEHALLKAPLVRIGRNFLQTETGQLWQTIIQRSISIESDQLNAVCEGATKLSRLEVLTEWVNTRLLAHLKESGIVSDADITEEKITAVFNAIEKEFKESEPALTKALHTHKKMQDLSLQLEAWQDPEHVRKQTKQLIESFQNEGFTLDPTQAHSLTQQYEKASPLGKRAILKNTLEMVRLYDHLIKTVKSSTEYKDVRQQACDFKRLLDQYYVMMESVLSITQSEGFFTKSPGIDNDEAQSMLSINTYLERIRYGYSQPAEEASGETVNSLGFTHIDPRKLDAETAEQLMLPSDHFNVCTATLGSGSDYAFSTTWPNHLEDYFTLFHQNMESCISLLNSKQAVALTNLPSPVQKHTEAVLATLYRSSITSISIEQGVVQVAFNVPLRQHAATLVMSYDLKKPEGISPVKLKMSVFGRDENSRWKMMAGAVSLIDDNLKGLKTEKPELTLENANGIIFELESLSQNASEQQAIISFLAKLNSLSMSASTTSDYLKAIKNLRSNFTSHEPATLTRTQIENGAFYLCLELAQESLLDGDFDTCQRIVDLIEESTSSNPSLKALRNEMGFFTEDKEKNLGSALDTMKKRLENAQKEGLPQSPWQRFEREKNKLASHPKHLLQAATSEQKKDPHFVKEAILADPDNILYADRTLKNNKDFMKELMEHHPKLYLYASATLQSDEELACLYARSPESDFAKMPSKVHQLESVINVAVEANGLNLGKIPETFRERFDLVEKAVQSNGLALQHAPSFKDNPRIVELAVRQNGLALGFASRSLVDETLALLAIETQKEAYKFTPESVKANPAIAYTCLKANPALAKQLPNSLKSDVDFVLQILKDLDPSHIEVLFQELPDQVRNLPPVTLLATSKKGLLIRHLDSRKITPDIACAALEQDPLSHAFIPKDLFNHEQVALSAVKGDGKLLFKCCDSLQSTKRVVLAAVSKDCSIFTSLPVSMQKDLDVSSAAWGRIDA